MPLFVWLALVFLVGLFVGDFLKLCADRLPYEKSILWPGARCDTCAGPIRFLDRVPLLGYALLGGRCRLCKARVSLTYPLVALVVASALVGLFVLDAVVNATDLPSLRKAEGEPVAGLALFGHHAVLLCFLLVASLCDLADMEIPLPLTVTGTLVGLVLATLLPWPFPEPLPAPPPPPTMPAMGLPLVVSPPTAGVYPWPVWYPLPEWLPAAARQLGFATGLAGVVAGVVMLRGVRFLFGLGRGVEGLGVGDADLMMMAGAFVGWQPVVLAFFVAVGPALVFALGHLAIKGDQALPFGPSLALGVMITVLMWPSLAPAFAPMFFDVIFLSIMGVGGGLALLGISFLLRLTRG